MKPLVREYSNEHSLVEDVKQLVHRGISNEEIYVLSHQDERTKEIAEKADVNTIGLKELGMYNSIDTWFSEKGRELRRKMEEMGVSEAAAKLYEVKLDEGKVLLFVTDTEKINTLV